MSDVVVVLPNGRRVSWMQIVGQMDTEICSAMADSGVYPCTEQHFTDEYCKLHKVNYRKEFNPT